MSTPQPERIVDASNGGIANRAPRPKKQETGLRRASAALVLAIFLCALAPDARSADRNTANLILIEKSAHTMKLMRGSEVLKTYKVALSTVPVGPKEREGDHRVPEGKYFVDRKNPASKFDRALHVSYPNAADVELARKLGVKPGGDIEIHGLSRQYAFVGSLHRQADWTNGCIAVTNSEIEEIWPLLPVGTRIEIRP